MRVPISDASGDEKVPPLSAGSGGDAARAAIREMPNSFPINGILRGASSILYCTMLLLLLG